MHARLLCPAACTAIVLVLAGSTSADEGFWSPDTLAELGAPSLKEQGFRLTPEAILGPGGTGLGSAVVRVGPCSGAFVGDSGVILTARSCIADALPEEDPQGGAILPDPSSGAPRLPYEAGFLARTWSEERRLPRLTVEVPRGAEDVTARLAEGVDPGLGDLALALALERRAREIVADCEAAPGIRCRVSRPYGAERFTLHASLSLEDVRLIFLPPLAATRFGGVATERSWPGHAAPLALLRAHMPPGPEGRPIPYRPARFLSIDGHGVRPGDHVVVLGYPSDTFRLAPAAVLERDLAGLLTAAVDLDAEWQASLEVAAQGGRRAAPATRPDRERIGRRLERNRAALESERREGVVAHRRAREAWLAGMEDDGVAAADLLARLSRAVEPRGKSAGRDLLLSRLQEGPATLEAARLLLVHASEQGKPDLDRRAGFQERDHARIRARLAGIASRFDPEAERAVLTLFLRHALALPPAERIAPLEDLFVAGRGAGVDPETMARDLAGAVAASTRLGEEGRAAGLMTASREELGALGDGMIDLAARLIPAWDALDDRMREESAALSRHLAAHAALLSGVRESPRPLDGDGTLRASFGTVKGYSPREGIWMEPQTSLVGLLDRMRADPRLAWPDAYKEAVRDDRSRRWRQPSLGGVPACFLTDADLAAGSPGSPVTSARGALVGMVIDQVADAPAAEYAYDARRTRAVSADVRYLLWILERVEKAYPVMRDLGVEPAPSGVMARDAAP